MDMQIAAVAAKGEDAGNFPNAVIINFDLTSDRDIFIIALEYLNEALLGAPGDPFVLIDENPASPQLALHNLENDCITNETPIAIIIGVAHQEIYEGLLAHFDDEDPGAADSLREEMAEYKLFPSVGVTLH